MPDQVRHDAKRSPTAQLDAELINHSRDCFKGIQRFKIKADRLVQPEEYNQYFED